MTAIWRTVLAAPSHKAWTGCEGADGPNPLESLCTDGVLVEGLFPLGRDWYCAVNGRRDISSPQDHAEEDVGPETGLENPAEQ